MLNLPIKTRTARLMGTLYGRRRISLEIICDREDIGCMSFSRASWSAKAAMTKIALMVILIGLLLLAVHLTALPRQHKR